MDKQIKRTILLPKEQESLREEVRVYTKDWTRELLKGEKIVLAVKYAVSTTVITRYAKRFANNHKKAYEQLQIYTEKNKNGAKHSGEKSLWDILGISENSII